MAELTDFVCGELHSLIGSKYSLPSISCIKAHHTSNKICVIYFYEYLLVNLVNGEVIFKKTVGEDISDKTGEFRGRDSNVPEGKEVMGLYPELPILELNRTEYVFILCSVLMLEACLAMVIEFYNFLLTHQHEDGFLLRSFQVIIIVSPIGLFVLFVTIALYKYYFKP